MNEKKIPKSERERIERKNVEANKSKHTAHHDLSGPRGKPGGQGVKKSAHR